MTLLESQLIEALAMLRAVAVLVPSEVWAKASDEYNSQFIPKNINEYKFTCDIARDALDCATALYVDGGPY